jgi:hypothetical protein
MFPKIEFKSEFGERLKECHCKVVLFENELSGRSNQVLATEHNRIYWFIYCRYESMQWMSHTY